MPSPLGDKIRARRTHLELSLEDLAKQTDSSKGYLWELENRDNPNPSVDKLTKIATALGVTSEFLLESGKSTPDQEVLDQAFFRRYQGLDPKAKARLTRFLEWED